MASVTDKEVLKPGLIILRRGDVAHRNFHCRLKLPKADRYKTTAPTPSKLQSRTSRAHRW